MQTCMRTIPSQPRKHVAEGRQAGCPRSGHEKHWLPQQGRWQGGAQSRRAGGQAAQGRAGQGREYYLLTPPTLPLVPSCPPPRQGRVRVSPRPPAAVSVRPLPPSPTHPRLARSLAKRRGEEEKRRGEEKFCCIAAIAAGAVQFRDEENLTSHLTPGTRAEEKYSAAHQSVVVWWTISSHPISSLLLLLIITPEAQRERE